MNAPQTAQSLLSLPAGTTVPTPYAVLGLRPGETDPGKITAAVQAVVVKLNQAKSTADPSAWAQAATWVKESRRILADPALKSRLDQKIAADQPSAPQPPAPQPVNQPSRPSPQPVLVDPLAGLLPGQSAGQSAGQPIGLPAMPATATPATFRPGSVSTGGVSVPAPPPPPPPPAPVMTAAAAIGVAPAAAFDAGPQGVSADFSTLAALPQPTPAARRRKKRSPWAPVLVVGLTLACVGGIIGLVVYLDRMPGGITIAIGPNHGGDANPVVAPSTNVQPPARRQTEPRDPVMGGVAPADLRPDRKPRSMDESAGDWLVDLPHQDEGAGEAMPAAMAPAEPAMTQPADASMPMSPTPETSPVPGESAPAMDESSAAAQAALEKARQTLAAAQWDQMNAATESALRAAMTGDQKRLAQELVELAELATYYHGGVEKAIDGLKATESIRVTDQLEILVVEISPQTVVLRVNGKNKDYPRSQLPLVVVHKIAGFAMPVDSPTTQAAAQVYQALAPVTTPPYRAQAIKTLLAMSPPPDDVDPESLVSAIRQVFPDE